MDTENVPLDMNALYAKERSMGFTLPSFIADRLSDVHVIASIDTELYDSVIKEHPIERSEGRYVSEVDRALKVKIEEMGKADLKVWETHINPSKGIGVGAGRMLEAVLFSYATGDFDTTQNGFTNMMNVLANYFVLFPKKNESQLDSISPLTKIPSAIGEVTGNIAARLYKQRSLHSRKKDLEEFFRSEGIINE